MSHVLTTNVFGNDLSLNLTVDTVKPAILLINKSALNKNLKYLKYDFKFWQIQRGSKVRGQEGKKTETQIIL